MDLPLQMQEVIELEMKRRSGELLFHVKLQDQMKCTSRRNNDWEHYLIEGRTSVEEKRGTLVVSGKSFFKGQGASSLTHQMAVAVGGSR